MMIGSPDLLAFTAGEDFGEGVSNQDVQSLPEELSVPLFPVSHPWATPAKFHRDFILVAEFSEQVGPRPVLTIPNDPSVVGSFDLNHFSLRIMSVDYQVSWPGPVSPASPGLRLTFSEDSEVVLGDSDEGAFAFVHHLTLYDLEARGLVRPFCIAYVSSDQAKLTEHFFELSTCLAQASESLKTGNRRAFATELQRRLQELEYKRLTLHKEAEIQTTADELTAVEEKTNELAAVECSILDHRELLRQVSSYPNRKLKKPDFLPYDPADDLADPLGLLTSNPFPIPSSASLCRFERRLKPLEELSDAYFLSLTLEQLADTERRLHVDGSVLRTTRVTHALSKKLSLTNFLFEPWIPEEEAEEKEDHKEAGAQRVKEGTAAAGSLPVTGASLESFHSCVEEIPIKLEAGQEGKVTPDSENGMTGSMSSGDSIEVLGTEKSYRIQCVVTGNDTREGSAVMSDACVKRVAAEAGIRRVPASARRANSEDSIEVLSTTDSIFPEDLTAITEEEPEHQLLSNGLWDEEAAIYYKELLKNRNYFLKEEAEEELIQEEGSPMEAAQGNEDQREGFAQQEDDPVDGEESLMQGLVGIKVQEEEKPIQEVERNLVHQEIGKETVFTPLQVQETVEPVALWSDVCQRVEQVQMAPDLHVDFAEAVKWFPSAPTSSLSVDEAYECACLPSSSPCSPDPPPLLTHSLHLTCHSDQKRRKAGLRALRFLQQNSFSQHVIFCLLSGRPLVVIGGNESSVRKLVAALALFLPDPGPEANALLPCLTTPLQLTDLLRWRLIGIHRSSSSTSSSVLHSLARYGRYLALLDLDQRTLLCPPYSGSLIGRLADPHTRICSGDTFLLHLESCLTALTSQALLYTFNSALHPPDISGRHNFTQRRDSPVEWGFCRSEDDRRVMHFLSELIKQHHVGHGPPILRFYYSSLKLHKNTIAT
ncbi:guanine nucleotide exchange protein smcr8a-like [Lampris incognitus]|uniref:guanine nucleotide exchange protein smcr8a-like n=1 Tax=Lampris incognitus TaxID=2546036 RepID=UPI0024B613F4|nr:guanine nucleotide exchange protein smcr8a-like [Lampris incognitus]